jgi:hypothetical protein
MTLEVPITSTNALAQAFRDELGALNDARAQRAQDVADTALYRKRAEVAAAATLAAVAAGGGVPTIPTFSIKGLAVEGDSQSTITNGNPNPWPAQFGTLTGLPVFNYAQSSTTLAQMKDNYGANDHAGPHFDPNTCNCMVVGSAGTNDLSNDATTVADLKANIQILAGRGKATGYIVYVTTILPRGYNWSDAREAKRVEYNTWLLATASTFCDGCLDFAGALTTADLYDLLHPSDAAALKLANVLKAKVTNAGGSTGPVLGDTSITTNGAIDPAKYSAMAAKLSRPDGIAYRYGPPAPAVANKPTYFQPSDHPWDESVVGTHSGFWQLGTFRTYDGAFQGGDFSSNSLIVNFVADDPAARIGTTELQANSTDHGTWAQKPELSWTRYGAGIDAVEAVYWKNVQGKTVQNPVASANAFGRPGWAVQPLHVHQNGFVCTSGFNTMTNKSSCQLPAGLVPSAVAITSANEFGLITCWDTARTQGVLVVVSLCGLGHGATIANPNNGRWWDEWIEPHPGLHNLGNLVFQKVLGYIDLPGMKAPTEISATTHHPRYGYLDGSEGEPSCYNQAFSNESIRVNWKPGGSRSNNYAKQGECVIISKTEKMAIWVNLKPLFDYINSMYFGTRDQYLETTNIGQNSGQWPYTFAERPQQKPTITKTVLFDDEPTCLFLAPYAKREEWRQVVFGFKNGKARVWNTGGVNDTGNAAAKTEAFSFDVGLNPTSVCWINEKSRETEKGLVPETTRQFAFCVRGEAAIKWFDLGTNTATQRRVFRDSRVIDPIHYVDCYNHGAESYFGDVSDYSNRMIHGVRWGPTIMWTYPEQTRLPMGSDGRAEFEYAGAFVLPGYPFHATSANVS